MASHPEFVTAADSQNSTLQVTSTLELPNRACRVLHTVFSGEPFQAVSTDADSYQGKGANRIVCRDGFTHKRSIASGIATGRKSR